MTDFPQHIKKALASIQSALTSIDQGNDPLGCIYDIRDAAQIAISKCRATRAEALLLENERLRKELGK